MPACMGRFRDTVAWSGFKGIPHSQQDGVAWSSSCLVQMCSWNLWLCCSVLSVARCSCSSWLYLKFYYAGLSFRRGLLSNTRVANTAAGDSQFCASVKWTGKLCLNFFCLGLLALTRHRSTGKTGLISLTWLVFRQMLLFRHLVARFGKCI